MSLLQGPSPKQLEVIMQELGEGPGDIERGVRDLRSMCAASPHLPQPDRLETKFLELFVRGCRMDIARARTKFEAFCLSRWRQRDLYEYKSLNEAPLNNTCDFIDIVPLPKLTDEGIRVTLFRIKAGYSESSADMGAVIRAILLVADARMHDEKPITGDAFVWDTTHIRGSLVPRMAASLSTIRRGINLAQAAYPQRLKKIYVVGAPTFLASTLQIMRSCMNEKVKSRFYLLSKPEELLDQIPARVLPMEWGGQEDSIDSLSRKWRTRVDQVGDYLRELNELYKAKPFLNKCANDELYGTVGAFRKLDID